MKKLKTIWLPRASSIYVWQGFTVPRQKVDEQLITISQNNVTTGRQHNRTFKQSAFLLKEIEENNYWARLGAKIYFGWFSLIFIINACATGWLFTYGGVRPPYARLIFLIFIGLNLMGTIVTYFIRNHMLDCDRRIRDVLEGLKQEYPSEVPYTEPRSAVPRQIVNVMFAFTGIAFFMLFLFWLILEFWPHVFLL
jgi:hypothetical protein